MFFQQLINGITVGGNYALIALGYTMVYGILKIVNFAHGDVFMMGSFLGSVYKNSAGELVLEIDIGQNPDSLVPIIGKSDIRFKSAEQRLDDIMNDITVIYKYNHMVNDFISEVNTSDALSQELYTKRSLSLPLHWCVDKTSATDIADILRQSSGRILPPRQVSLFRDL